MNENKMGAWRPFTETDWYGLAGATRFPSGDEPAICEGYIIGMGEAELVIDAHGAQVIHYDIDSNGTWAWDTDSPGGVGFLVLAARTPFTVSDLEVNGFTKIMDGE